MVNMASGKALGRVLFPSAAVASRKDGDLSHIGCIFKK